MDIKIEIDEVISLEQEIPPEKQWSCLEVENGGQRLISFDKIERYK